MKIRNGRYIININTATAFQTNEGLLGYVLIHTDDAISIAIVQPDGGALMLTYNMTINSPSYWQINCADWQTFPDAAYSALVAAGLMLDMG